MVAPPTQLKQEAAVVIPSLLDGHVDARSPQSTAQPPEPDLVRTYLRNAGSKFSGLSSARREQPEANRAQDLWDYLGDFA